MSRSEKYPNLDADCVFCRIFVGDEPASVLYRDHHVVVITPLNPVVEGHAISIPSRHAVDFTDNWEATVDATRGAFKYARTLGGDCNLITSKGRAATQSVFHLHIHVVPRAENDGLALPWYSGKGRVRAAGEQPSA